MRVLALVEGQTEERFVKDLLYPNLRSVGVFITPTLLSTKRVKTGGGFKGGVTSYAKFKRDLLRLLSSAKDGVVTTMVDYYMLPHDFPGMEDRPGGRAVERVKHVENAISEDVGQPDNFLPYLSLHEFEALLFSSSDTLPNALTPPDKKAEFDAIRTGFQTPEEINETPGMSPSKRIDRLFPAYRKTIHGPYVAGSIGLEKMRSECPHFDEWVSSLESLGGGGSS